MEFVRTEQHLGDCVAIQGLINGVTFSMQVPGPVNKSTADALTSRVVEAIRESVFPGAVALPAEPVVMVHHSSDTV